MPPKQPKLWFQLFIGLFIFLDSVAVNAAGEEAREDSEENLGLKVNQVQRAPRVPRSVKHVFHIFHFQNIRYWKDYIGRILRGAGDPAV